MKNISRIPQRIRERLATGWADRAQREPFSVSKDYSAGMAALYREDLDTANAIFSRMAEHSDRKARAVGLAMLAYLANENGRDDESRNRYLEIASIDPGDVWAQLSQAEDALRSGNHETAERILRKTLATLDERESDAVQFLAVRYADLLRQVGRHEEIAEMFDDLIRRFPNQGVLVDIKSYFRDAAE